jgi:predicted HicB family RNase H-like nuclease
MDTPKKRSRGRPPGKVPGSRRSGDAFQFRVSVDEARVIAAAARAERVSVSEFIRRAALAAAADMDLNGCPLSPEELFRMRGGG